MNDSFIEIRGALENAFNNVNITLVFVGKNNLNGVGPAQDRWRPRVKEVGAMRGPMPKCEPPFAHIIVSSLPTALAFCSFPSGVMSPSTHASTNV